MKKILLLDGDRIDKIKIDEIEFDKVFSFDILSHKFLIEQNIPHILADELIDSDERKKIFDHVVSKLYWYKDEKFNHEFDIDGYNVLDMLDPLYLHQKLLVILIKFSIIKKILENEKPSHIFLSNTLSQIVLSLDHNMHLTLLNTEKIEAFDRFDIRLNFFSKIIPITISMKKLKIIQTIYEHFIASIFHFWLDTNDKKPIILLLEFDPTQFSELLINLKNKNFNLVVLNRRKSSLRNFKSIKIMKNSNAKLINFTKLLNNDEKAQIISFQKQFNSKLENLWKNDEYLSKIFSFENSSYWFCIKDFLKKQYENDMSNNIENLVESNFFFTKTNTKCILYQYESGNFENVTLSQRKNSKSLLIRHGFSSYQTKFDELRWRHDQFRLVKLNCDEIILWGECDYNFYKKYISDSIKLKVIGSPRHDQFFENSKILKSLEKLQTILITAPPIIEWTGLADTQLALRYEKTLKQLISELKKLNNFKIVAKLHPGWGWRFNSVLLKIFNEIDPQIPVYSSESIKQLISESDLIININAEDNQPSTVILEGLIMKKPVINISLNEDNDEFEYDPNMPFISLSYKADILFYIQKIFHEYSFTNYLNDQITQFLKKYLSNHKTASRELAHHLQSFL